MKSHGKKFFINRYLTVANVDWESNSSDTKEVLDEVGIWQVRNTTHKHMDDIIDFTEKVQ